MFNEYQTKQAWGLLCYYDICFSQTFRSMMTVQGSQAQDVGCWCLLRSPSRRSSTISRGDQFAWAYLVTTCKSMPVPPASKAVCPCWTVINFTSQFPSLSAPHLIVSCLISKKAGVTSTSLLRVEPHDDEWETDTPTRRPRSAHSSRL